MAGQAGWAVKLKGITVGGDFDVLAWIDVLVHVETKARRPEDISNDELLNFLQRGEELSPEIQVLLIDTDDDLQPFVDRMVRQAMVAPIRRANAGLPASFPEADHMFVKLDAPYEGLYRWGRRVYVSNTQVGVAEALRRCVRHYNRIGRHLLIPTSETPMNWVPVPKSPDPDGTVD